MPDQGAPSDLLAHQFPVSIKGVVEVAGRFVLLRNERDEWELPGGKLEENEQPTECLEREILEELNLRVEATSCLDAWIYDVLGKVKVLVVTFGTRVLGRAGAMRVSVEHKEMGLFSYAEVAALRMPDGYKRSIALYRDAMEVPAPARRG